MTYEKERCCFNCQAFMGGGECRVGLKNECKVNGVYGSWRPRQRFVFHDMARQYVEDIGHKGGYSIRKVMGHYVLTLFENEETGEDG